jgi:undecaprenyl-diphosphatase
MAAGFHKTNLALLAGLLFGFTAVALDTLYEGPLTILEQHIAPAIDYRAFPELAPVMLTLSDLGSTVFVSVVAGIIGLVLLCERRYKPAFMLIAAVYGGIFINAALKQVFQRARPIVEDPVLLLQTYSFPSGHAAAATVLYGSLAILATRAWPGSRAPAFASAALLIAIVGVSRVYLGVHHLTDVLAGAFAAAAWLLFCYTLIYRSSGPGRALA